MIRRIGVRDVVSGRRAFLGSGIFALCGMVFIAGVSLPASANAADNSVAAEAHVNAMIGAAQGLLKTDNGDLETRTTAVTKLLDAYFDFPAIARFSAGQYWRAASEAEQREYTLVLHDVIVGNVVRNFDKLAGLDYSHKSSTTKGDKLVLVTGEFTDQTGARPPVLVNWRVATLPDQPPAVMDIEIENISMLVTQKQENVAIIRQNKGEFAALIEAMRAKTTE